MSLLLRVLTPHSEVVSRYVESATLHDVEGEFTILDGHTHIIKRLYSGIMRYLVRDEEDALIKKRLWTAGGIAEVSREGILTVLTDDVGEVGPEAP